MSRSLPLPYLNPRQSRSPPRLLRSQRLRSPNNRPCDSRSRDNMCDSQILCPFQRGLLNIHLQAMRIRSAHHLRHKRLMLFLRNHIKLPSRTRRPFLHISRVLSLQLPVTR
jgi:hypothetical protein